MLTVLINANFIAFISPLVIFFKIECSDLAVRFCVSGNNWILDEVDEGIPEPKMERT